MITMPRYTQPSRFLRVSKYLFPADWSAFSVASSWSAAGTISTEELGRRYPDSATFMAMGHDRDWGNFSAEFIRAGVIATRPIAADPTIPLSVGIYEGFSTVGRDCRVIAPDGRKVDERGYDAAHSQKVTDVRKGLNPSYWHRLLKTYAAKHRALPPAQSLPGTAAILNNRSPHNFYHWLLEVVPRISLMKRAGLTSDWYIIDSQSNFQRRILSMLGIELDRVIQPHYGMHLFLDKLVRPSEPGVVATLDFAASVKEQLKNHVETKRRDAPLRIYISRRNAAHRKVANELVLQQWLNRKGFETVDFESIDFAEQVRLVSSADAIVAVHGAALANLIFAKPNTPVIEICPSNRYNIDCFPRISHICGLRHVSILAESKGQQSLTVNLDEMQLALERLNIV